jgi:hypothetical protein
MFEKASRQKIRFLHRGQCSVEDLWDLPLTALDSIFKGLNAQSKAQKEESLLATKSQADEVLALQIAIVKRVVEVRLAEQAERQSAADKAAQKQKLLGIIAEKQDAELKNMSLEELTKLVNEL